MLYAIPFYKLCIAEHSIRKMNDDERKLNPKFLMSSLFEKERLQKLYDLSIKTKTRSQTKDLPEFPNLMENLSSTFLYNRNQYPHARKKFEAIIKNEWSLAASPSSKTLVFFIDNPQFFLQECFLIYLLCPAARRVWFVLGRKCEINWMAWEEMVQALKLSMEDTVPEISIYDSIFTFLHAARQEQEECFCVIGPDHQVDTQFTVNILTAAANPRNISTLVCVQGNEIKLYHSMLQLKKLWRIYTDISERDKAQNSYSAWKSKSSGLGLSFIRTLFYLCFAIYACLASKTLWGGQNLPVPEIWLLLSMLLYPCLNCLEHRNHNYQKQLNAQFDLLAEYQILHV